MRLKFLLETPSGGHPPNDKLFKALFVGPENAAAFFQGTARTLGPVLPCPLDQDRESWKKRSGPGNTKIRFGRVPDDLAGRLKQFQSVETLDALALAAIRSRSFIANCQAIGFRPGYRKRLESGLGPEERGGLAPREICSEGQFLFHSCNVLCNNPKKISFSPRPPASQRRA